MGLVCVLLSVNGLTAAQDVSDAGILEAQSAAPPPTEPSSATVPKAETEGDEVSPQVVPDVSPAETAEPSTAAPSPISYPQAVDAEQPRKVVANANAQPYADPAIESRDEPPRLAGWLDNERGDAIAAAHLSRYGDERLGVALTRFAGVGFASFAPLTVDGFSPGGELMVNGLRLASPQFMPPEKFPIGVLNADNGLFDQLHVHRIYEPFLPGELGGGIVNLQTARPPPQTMVRASVASAARTGTTFHTHPSHAGGSTDFLGFDDGSRDAPEQLPSDYMIATGNPKPDGSVVVQQDRQQAARWFSNRWDAQGQTITPDSALALSAGDEVNLGSVPLGYTLAVTHQRNSNFSRMTKRLVQPSLNSPDGVSVLAEGTDQVTTTDVGLGAHAGISLEPATGHVLRVNALVVRDTVDTTDVSLADNFNRNQELSSTVLTYRERQAAGVQVASENALGSMASLNLRYGYGTGVDNQPDYRSTVFGRAQVAGATWSLQIPVDRAYNRDVEFSHDMGADIAATIPLSSDVNLSPRVGASVLLRQHRADGRSFAFESVQATSIAATPADFGFSFESIVSNATDLELMETTTPSAQWHDYQTLVSPYAMCELQLGDAWHAMLGSRYEYDRYVLNAAGQRNLREDNAWLPAAIVGWQPTDALLLRLSGSRTRVRPYGAVQLAPAVMSGPNVTNGRPDPISGNPNLRAFGVWNARVDAQLGNDRRAITLGTFAHAYDAPIVLGLITGSGPTGLAGIYRNAQGAITVGVDLSTQLDLELLGGALKYGYVATQLGVQSASLTMPPAPPSTNGAALYAENQDLAGAPNALFGAQLGYDETRAKGRGWRAALAYRYQGSSLYLAGALGMADQRAQPSHHLDAIVSYQLISQLSIGASARNLLNTADSVTIGGTTLAQQRLGRRFEIGATLTL